MCKYLILEVLSFSDHWVEGAEDTPRPINLLCFALGLLVEGWVRRLAASALLGERHACVVQILILDFVCGVELLLLLLLGVSNLHRLISRVLHTIYLDVRW